MIYEPYYNISLDLIVFYCVLLYHNYFITLIYYTIVSSYYITQLNHKFPVGNIKLSIIYRTVLNTI